MSLTGDCMEICIEILCSNLFENTAAFTAAPTLTVLIAVTVLSISYFTFPVFQF